MARLSGKVAIITGGARGMGEAHVRAFIKEGARVVLTDRLVDAGQALAAELGPNALFVEGDVSRPDSWVKLIEAAETAFGPVNVLVNNAGILLMNSLETESEADFRRVVEVNQMGVFFGMKAVLPSMRKAGGGSIVNIASTASCVGAEGIFSYVASKWAVRGMTKAAALELAKDNIRVNAVHPSEIETPMVKEMEDAGAAVSTDILPMKRLGKPHEVSAVVLFLASDESSFVTGSDYMVDGGLTAY